MDIITSTPLLDTLACKINEAIERRENSRDQWIAATISLCQYLATARAQFKDDIGFGTWFDASGIQLGHQDRAAAIAMGKEIEKAREVLQTTDRRSLQLIHAKEFGRFTSASKPRKPRAGAPDLERALHAYDRRKLAGESLDRNAIAEEIGTSITPARLAITQREAEEKLGAQAEIILSASAQERFDAKVRAFKKNFDYEVETKVMAGIKKHLEEYSIPSYLTLLRKVERMLEHKRGLMKRAEFRIIQRCLHPDTGAHVSDANRNEAFRLFMALEAKLVDDDREQADLKRVSTLPKTVEEMLARRTMKR